MRTSLLPLSMLLLLTSCLYTESSTIIKYKAENRKSANDQLATFLFGDMHGLTAKATQTNALPLKVALTAVVLQRQEKDPSIKIERSEIRKAFQSWGFIYSDSAPKGWDESEKMPTDDIIPIGIASGEILGREGKERMEIMNFSCSACHMGTGYEADGKPNLKHIPGLPNTSFDVDRYMGDIFSALLRFSNDKDFTKRVYKAMKELFPYVTERELRTTKLFHPLLKKTLNEFNKNFGAFIPSKFGGAGQSNAMALFKSQFGMTTGPNDLSNASYLSTPTLYWKGFRSNLLTDGSTAPPGHEYSREMTWADVDQKHINELARSAIFFPMLVTGASQKEAIKEIPNLEKLFTYFTHLSPERFPGKINTDLAKKGRAIFENKCSSCHGTYEGDLFDQQIVSYPNRIVKASKIGTDQARISGVTDEFVQRIKASPMAKYFTSQKTDGYVAPMLNSLWATAPYLHNGSVPSLWDMMHPASRPLVFKVGGHMLDFKKVGISYPEGYVPWTGSSLYNTLEPGRGNQGHEFPFNKMTEEEKEELLEYLKLL